MKNQPSPGIRTLLWKNKWYWLVPLVLTVVLLIVLAVLALTAGTGPSVYPMF